MAAVMKPKTGIADSYLYDRAEVELRLAQAADHPAAVRAHYLLAGYYLDRYYSNGGAQPPAIMPPVASPGQDEIPHEIGVTLRRSA